MRCSLALLLALAGCAGPIEAAAEAEPSEFADTGAEPAPVCDIDPELAGEAGEAIALWNAAAGATIPLPSRIELADFGADDQHAAAWSERFDALQVSTRTQPEKRASSIAHELGHLLGLSHAFGTGTLMDPDRPTAARLRPCITAELAAAAGFNGPGACLE